MRESVTPLVLGARRKEAIQHVTVRYTDNYTPLAGLVTTGGFRNDLPIRTGLTGH